MTVRILVGDVRTKLAGLDPESVHCIWTSVPYWGLRSYGTEPQIWDGDQACDHEWGAQQRNGKRTDIKPSSETTSTGRIGVDDRQGTAVLDGGRFCQHCEAWRGEHGLEPRLGMWLRHQVEIWRELRRVLRDDGTAWLNCGDAYANDGKWGGSTGGKHARGLHGEPVGRQKRSTGLKSKDRIMMPARLAIALQDDGWWLRDEIVWHKPNPMPSSVKDRTTPAHEMLYLLTKSARYYFDGDAIKEPFANGVENAAPWKSSGGARNIGGRDDGFARGTAPDWQPDAAGRNKRSVWTVNTEPFPGAHFATAPTELVKPCILAGSPKGGVVLDPFGGSGTTGMVADRLGRDAVLIELNPEYAEIARQRVKGDAPLFVDLQSRPIEMPVRGDDAPLFAGAAK